jgi:hypothetical protein
MMDSAEKKDPQKENKSTWLWPAGVAATGVAGMVLLLLRGCWHRKMSWPVRAQGHAYQVCLGCGVKRLFDENRFRSYGPFSYSLDDLAEWQRSQRLRPATKPAEARPAS